MKNKILLILLAAVLAISLSLIGCAQEEPAPQVIHLIFSTDWPSFNCGGRAVTAYANYIADHSDGKVEIEKIGYEGEIVSELEVFEGV